MATRLHGLQKQPWLRRRNRSGGVDFFAEACLKRAYHRMSEVQTQLVQRIQQKGAAAVARELGVSRAGLLSYVAGAAHKATRIVIEQQATRLATADGAR